MKNGIAVVVEGVVKSYGSVVALDGVDLAIERGTVYGLLGPNGAGKTTLVKILTTLIPPDRGRATVEGLDVVARAAEVRNRIGLAGQAAAVDEFLTGRENLEMVGALYNLSRSEIRKRTDQVLERIDLGHAADRPTKTYSGGMRRRLDLAASLVGRPEVLFLDEPTTGLDPSGRLGLWDLIEELVAEGTTVLLTTQYLEEADRLANRIGVIDHGRLISEGTAMELKDRLGQDVLEVHVSASTWPEAAAVLSELSQEEPQSNTIGQVTIPAPQGARTLVEAVRRLDERGVEIENLALRKPTLDDVFLSLTGKATPAQPESGESSAESSPINTRRSR